MKQNNKLHILYKHKIFHHGNIFVLQYLIVCLKVMIMQNNFRWT